MICFFWTSDLYLQLLKHSYLFLHLNSIHVNIVSNTTSNKEKKKHKILKHLYEMNKPILETVCIKARSRRENKLRRLKTTPQTKFQGNQEQERNYFQIKVTKNNNIQSYK